ncbi:MAG TPA: hypothetical protein VFE58_03175 [Tepidisphaeraceae bacterium]|jgi:hypothetical protein|nr:hypothetical protein [Tepidisphaeraceae bacterium]
MKPAKPTHSRPLTAKSPDLSQPPENPPGTAKSFGYPTPRKASPPPPDIDRIEMSERWDGFQ